MGNRQQTNDNLDNITYITVSELSSHISKASMEQNETTKQKLQKFQVMAQEFMKNSAKILQKKNSIIMLGKTGTCKSTIIELLSFNSNLKIVEVNGITQVHGSDRIGNKSVSHTQQLYEKEIYQDVYLIDTPGIDDTRGQLQDIENSLNIQQAINTSENVKIVYCILFEDTKGRQNELQRVIDDLIRLTLANQSIGIIITKVPTKMPLIEENNQILIQIKTRIRSMIDQMDKEKEVRDTIYDLFENNTTLFNDPLDLDADRIFQYNRNEINNMINKLKFTNEIQKRNYLLLSANTKQYYQQLLDNIIKQIKEILQDIQNRLIDYIVQISKQKYISNRSKSILEGFIQIIPDRIKIKDLCLVIVNINQFNHKNKIDIKLKDQQLELLAFYSFIVGQILVDYLELQKSINLFPLKAQIYKAINKCQQVIDKIAKDNIIYIEQENRLISRQRKFKDHFIKTTAIIPFSVGGAVLGPIGLLVGFTFGVSLAYTLVYLDNQNGQRQNN